MSKPDAKPLEIIYNSVCPVCDAGICRFQKKVNPTHGGYIWLDINTLPERLLAFDIGVDEVRMKLHAIDRQGKLKVGAEAVAAIFAEIPRYKALAFLMRLPLLKTVAALLYNITAQLLYKWNKSKGRW